MQVSSTSGSWTPGNTTVIEAKIDAQANHITQLIGECVISSNLHCSTGESVGVT